ncbi:MAG: hypothetical protein ACWA42_10895 [Lutibacter sp.]
MNILKKILNFYIFSNLHVAIAGFCLTQITLIKYNINSYIASFVVAFGIIISYNFIRYFEIDKKRLGWFKDWFYNNLKYLILISILSLVGLFYIVFKGMFNFHSLLILIPFGFITFFYAIPIIKIKKISISFRNFPGIKIFSIALAWAGITVLFPIQEAKSDLSNMVWVDFFARFLLVVAYTIPFDIRDMKYDDFDLKTIPQLLGVRGAKQLAVGLIILFEILNYSTSLNQIYAIKDLIFGLIALFFIWKSNENKLHFYTSFWVEAIPIYWLILYLF